MDPEQPNRFVLMSEELIKQLGEWSEPVQIRVTSSAPGQYEMEVRTVEGANNDR